MAGISRLKENGCVRACDFFITRSSQRTPNGAPLLQGSGDTVVLLSTLDALKPTIKDTQHKGERASPSSDFACSTSDRWLLPFSIGRDIVSFRHLALQPPSRILLLALRACVGQSVLTFTFPYFTCLSRWQTPPPPRAREV
jgi:hypothetical protein